MNASLWERVNRVLDELEGLSPRDQESALVSLGSKDRELETEVRRQVAAMGASSSQFLHIGGGSSVFPVNRNGAPTVGPEYRIVRRVGGGLGGVVYEAVQEPILRRVALKVAPRVDHDHAARLIREARILGSLSSAGIASVHSSGENEDWVWVAMEYLDGNDLAQEIMLQSGLEAPDARPAVLPATGQSGFLRWRVKVVLQVAEALQDAHAAGILHRDVKPANIVLESTGRPKLVDFGMAHAANVEVITAPHLISGTPAFLAPERIGGGEADVRGDVYALGVTLFQLVSGQLPFLGSGQELIRSVGSGVTPLLRARVRGVPKDLDSVCAKAMAYSPEDRYRSAGEFSEDLRCFLAKKPVVARRNTLARRAWLVVRRRRREAIAGLLVMGVLAFAMAVSNSYGRSGQAGDSARRELDVLAQLIPIDLNRSASSALLSHRKRIVRLLDAGHLGKQGRARASQLLSSVEARALATVTEMEGLLEAELSPGQDPVNEENVLAIRRALREARQLLGQDAGQRGGDFPSVWVSGLPPSVRVEFWPVDRVTGEYPECTFSISGEVHVPPGSYRLVARDGQRFAELSRWIGHSGSRTVINSIRLRAVEDCAEEMVLIPPGSAAVLHPSMEREWRDVQVRSFWIDRCEVSNAQYLEFVLAKGSATGGSLRPRHWASLDVTDEEWLVRPVVGVSWLQARNYAEWAGKRLPTAAEWNRAALWTLDAANQEAATDRVEALGNGLQIGAAMDQSDLSPSRMMAAYLAATYDVDVPHPLAAPARPEVRHLFTNLAEWTDSVPLGMVGGRLRPLLAFRKVKGWSWFTRQPQQIFSYEERAAAREMSPVLRVGFRCAKSQLD